MQFTQSATAFDPSLMPPSANPFHAVPYGGQQPLMPNVQSTFGGQQHYNFYPQPFMGGGQQPPMDMNFGYNQIPPSIMSPPAFYPSQNGLPAS
jgi:hypothetical protein